MGHIHMIISERHGPSYQLYEDSSQLFKSEGSSPLPKSSHQTHGFTAFKFTNDCKIGFRGQPTSWQIRLNNSWRNPPVTTRFPLYFLAEPRARSLVADSIYILNWPRENFKSFFPFIHSSRFVSSSAKMVASRAFIGVATIAALVQVAIGASFTVGGLNGGWDLSTSLAQWAATQKFTVGDSLTFKYASVHDVLEVSKADYDACATSKPMNSYTGGSTAVKLSSPGKRYFICGTPGHCSQGMKVEIDVVAAATATPPTAAAFPPLAKSSAPVPEPEAPTSSKPSKAAPSKAPSSSPATISPSSQPSASGLPATTSPAPPPGSAANGLGQNTKVAMGFGVGIMLLVLAI